MNENEKVFPGKLRQARKERKLSQTELADKAGVSLTTVRRYETGERFPDKDIFGLILLALHKNGLTEAWARDYKIWHPETSVSFNELVNMAQSSVQEISLRNFIVNAGRKTTMDFIDQYFVITQNLLAMDKEGVSKVTEFSGLMRKIPEYQNKTSWIKKQETDFGEANDGEADDGEANDATEDNEE